MQMCCLFCAQKNSVCVQQLPILLSVGVDVDRFSHLRWGFLR